MNISKGAFIEIACPSCSYGIDVDLLSIRLQERVFCPCCKISIQLIDDNATLFAAEETIEAAVEDLTKSLQKLNTTIKISL